ncbi:hypothetical protein ACTXT7_016840, partial [Hymenolepis weldensis]
MIRVFLAITHKISRQTNKKVSYQARQIYGALELELEGSASDFDFRSWSFCFGSSLNTLFAYGVRDVVHDIRHGEDVFVLQGDLSVLL